VRATGAAHLLRIFASVMSAGHARFPEVTLARSPWFRIESLGEPLPVAFDGELGPHVTPLALRCRPAAVEVLCPAPVAGEEVRDAA
jgi:diacylglycerol kinase family enzyme